MQDLSLEKLDAVRLAIEQAATVQEIKSTLDMAHAAEVYAKQARLGKDIQEKARQYIDRAERKLGEMLAQAKATGQITHDHGNRYKKVVPDENNLVFTLEQAGIDRKLSMRAQQKARMPEEAFEQMLKEGKKSKVNSKKIKKEPPKAHYRASEVMSRHDSGDNNSEIADATGLSKRVVDDIVHEERIRRTYEPVISREELSLSAQQKFDVAVKQEKARLAASFAAAVDSNIKEILVGSVGPRLAKEQQEARWIMKSRHGVMNRKEFNQIRKCLHADTFAGLPLSDTLKEELNAAFSKFTSLEKFLLKEKESPTTFTTVPSTLEEWDELRKKATEERKRKRAAAKGASGITTK